MFKQISSQTNLPCPSSSMRRRWRSAALLSVVGFALASGTGRYSYVTYSTRYEYLVPRICVPGRISVPTSSGNFCIFTRRSKAKRGKMRVPMLTMRGLPTTSNSSYRPMWSLRDDMDAWLPLISVEQSFFVMRSFARVLCRESKWKMSTSEGADTYHEESNDHFRRSISVATLILRRDERGGTANEGAMVFFVMRCLPRESRRKIM